MELDHSRTELLYIPGDWPPRQDSVISTLSGNAHNLGVVLDYHLSSSPHTANLLCFFLQHQEDLAVSIHRGYSGACSVPCLLKTGLRLLASGRCLPTLASDPAAWLPLYSYTTPPPQLDLTHYFSRYTKVTTLLWSGTQVNEIPLAVQTAESQDKTR